MAAQRRQGGPVNIVNDAAMLGAWCNRLVALRQERCLTQAEVAERSGVGEKTISSLETGQRFASVKVIQLMKICGAYGITMGQFFAEVQEEPPPWRTKTWRTKRWTEERSG